MSKTGKHSFRKKVIAIAAIFVMVMTAAFIYTPQINPHAAVQYEDIEKFPESYKSALYALKEKHPNWTFEVMDTGLNWNDVVYNEMNPSNRSLVPTYFDSKFVGSYYGDGWSCATQEAVEYYLDPRNWLTEDYIFQFEKLTYSESTQGIATVQKVLQNTFMSGFIQSDAQNNYEEMGLTYAQAFFDIGKRIGVSPVHLATRVKQEQGTQGTSDLISGVYPGYEGYYNYYNIQASGSTHEQIVANGLNEAKSEGWNTRYAALYGGSQKVANRYILRGQDTLYLQKFDVDGKYDGRYWHQYMQNLAAPSNEGRNTKRAYESAGMLDEAFVFKIPVYNNMPGIPQEVSVEKGTYAIETVLNNGKVIEVSGLNYDNGANIGIWKDDGLSSQRFNITKKGDNYIITAVHSGKSLDIDNAGTAPGTNVQQWDANGTIAQQWKFYDAGDGYVYIKAPHNGLYLTVTANTDGANVNVQKYTGNDNQKFKLVKEPDKEVSISDGTYVITSAINSGVALEISGSSRDNGANLQVWGNEGLANQKFKIKKQNNNYVIKALHSAKSIDIDNAGLTSGTNVQQWDANGTVAQQWKFYDAGDGYVYIKSLCNGLYLTALSADYGANVNVQAFAGSDNQKFKLAEFIEKEVSVKDGTYIISSALNNDVVLEISGSSRDNGANLQVWGNAGLANQKFKIKKNNNNYTVTALHSAKSIDIDNGGQTPGTNVQQWDVNGTIAQQWKFYDAGDGYIYIKSMCNELYLTAVSSDYGSNVNVQAFSGANNQKFKLTEYIEKEVSVGEGIYSISTALNENVIIEISGSSWENGANLQVWGNEWLANQKFEVKKRGDNYTFTATHSGKNIDIDNGGQISGTNVQQWDSNGTAAQQWRFYDAGDGYVYIKSMCNELYLTATSSDYGANVNVQAFSGASNQKFKLTEYVEKEMTVEDGTYSIATALNESVVIEISGSSWDNGANLQVWRNESLDNQKFRIKKQGDKYTVIANHSGKSIDIDNAGQASGTNVQQWDFNGTIAQQWKFYDAGDGYVYIKSVCNGLYLTVQSSDNGANVNVQSFNGKTAQKFKLKK